MFCSEVPYPALSSAMMGADDSRTNKTPAADDIQQGQSKALPGTYYMCINDKNIKTDGTRNIDANQKGVVVSSDREGLKPPGLSYIALISMAIQSSEEKKMMLSEIYQWIAGRYPYYQLKDKSWRNSIRHNLSLNECFVKCGRSENGKGNYWSIHPANIEDFSKGDYRRRRARRRVRMLDEDLQRLCSNTPEIEEPKQMPSVCTSSQPGYVPMASSIVPSNFLSILGVDPIRTHEYWMANACSPRDMVYTQKPYINHYADVRCGNSPYKDNQTCVSCVPLFGRVNELDKITRTSPESTLNVNVNVHLSGNKEVQNYHPCYEIPSSTAYKGFENDSYL